MLLCQREIKVVFVNRWLEGDKPCYRVTVLVSGRYNYVCKPCHCQSEGDKVIFVNRVTVSG